MRAIRTSGLMSGDGKRGGAQTSVLAPILDSTNWPSLAPRSGLLLLGLALFLSKNPGQFRKRQSQKDEHEADQNAAIRDKHPQSDKDKDVDRTQKKHCFEDAARRQIVGNS
jgi:hypothetical protein